MSTEVTRVDLKVGFRCNNRCRFCVQGDRRDRDRDRTTEEVKQCLAQGRAWADEVVFTGGEPTVRRDLPALVTHARDLGFRVIQLQTNGRVLSRPSAVERLQEAGVTEFSPALHGPSAEIHDGLTRAPGSFRQTVRGIRNVKQVGGRVLVNSVITRDNAPHLPELARLLVALEVDQFQLAFVHALGSAAEDFEEVVPTLAEITGPVREALQIGLDGGVSVMTEAIPLCVLGDMRHLAAEWVMPRSRIYDAEQVVPDYTELRLAEGKAKGEVCHWCRLEPECEGPWKEYPERRGWDELEPILVSPEAASRSTRLSQDQVEHYWREGYVSNIDVLDAEEVRRFRQRLEQVEQQQRALRDGTWPNRHHLPRLGAEHPMRAWFHALVRDPRILEPVASILGPAILVRNADVFIKEPRSESGIGWHLDTTMRQPDADHYLTVWLGLTPSTPVNGGLLFNRGSHLEDLPEPHRPPDREHLHLTRTAEQLIDHSRTVDNVMAAGQMSLHHASMLHASDPNRFDDRRIGFVIRYMSTAIAPEAAECEVATLVRGRDTVGRFHLKDDFPVNWTPMVP